MHNISYILAEIYTDSITICTLHCKDYKVISVRDVHMVT